MYESSLIRQHSLFQHLSDFSIDVIQLETAAGAAIKNFKGAVGVNVPRYRFLPVKKTQDLLLVMSNLYELEDGVLGLSHKRSFPSLPLIKLGGTFDKVTLHLVFCYLSKRTFILSFLGSRFLASLPRNPRHFGTGPFDSIWRCDIWKRCCFESKLKLLTFIERWLSLFFHFREPLL